MGPATSRTLMKLKLLFDEHGVTDRFDRLMLCSDHAGRLLSSSKLLSQTEAHKLIVRLERLPRDGGVLAAADRLAERLRAVSGDGVDVARAGDTAVVAAGYELDRGDDGD